MRLRFDDFVLDLEARQLLRGSEEIHIRPKTYELLELLIGSRPRALSKIEIRRHLWPETAVEDVETIGDSIGGDGRWGGTEDSQRPTTPPRVVEEDG